MYINQILKTFINIKYVAIHDTISTLPIIRIAKQPKFTNFPRIYEENILFLSNNLKSFYS